MCIRDRVRRNQEPAAAVGVEAEDLEGPHERIDEPGVSDSFPCVDPHLPHAVEASCSRREDLADPIRRQGEVGDAQHLGHPALAPAGEVGDEDVAPEMKFRLKDDPPAPGATSPALVGAADVHAEDRRRDGVGARGTGRDVKLPSTISPTTWSGRARMSSYRAARWERIGVDILAILLPPSTALRTMKNPITEVVAECPALQPVLTAPPLGPLRHRVGALPPDPEPAWCSSLSAIQTLMIDWRVTPSRPASRSRNSIIQTGKSTLTRRCTWLTLRAFSRSRADEMSSPSSNLRSNSLAFIDGYLLW